VLSYESQTRIMTAANVVKVHRPFRASHYYVINGVIRVTENHPFLSGGDWRPASTLTVGDVMSQVSGGELEVRSIERVDEGAIVYNFQVSTGAFVAHGVIVHNKEDCLDFVQYCPDCED